MRNQTAVHACCITTWSHTNSVLLQSHTIVCIRQAVKIIITMDTNLILINYNLFSLWPVLVYYIIIHNSAAQSLKRLGHHVKLAQGQ